MGHLSVSVCWSPCRHNTDLPGCDERLVKLLVCVDTDLGPEKDHMYGRLKQPKDVLYCATAAVVVHFLVRKLDVLNDKRVCLVF